ncbi:MAG TPA: 2-C-methyl-D-erythritol 4-phosphate cytidylyltransferase [Lapillicoccus sp.]|jgi:2-C-methyl-D-erythritol 4-phosphate cytidylyltransferase|nr:2-C-methyl-D-erythritol 4-phosphate cytidylyltransferase [Lapillicoccus sp.]
MAEPRVGVVVVAAGVGARYGAGVPKAFVPLYGRSLLAWSVRTALECPGVGCVAIVAPSSHLAEAERETAEYADARVRVVAGGIERHDSVAAGLAVLPAELDVVLVHDAARAMTPSSLFAAVAAAVADGAPAVVPGLPVVDTIKQVDETGTVVATLPRAALRAVQTPQGFRRDVLERAYAAMRSALVTDDAALVEALGLPVLVIPGDPLAHKITTPADLDRVVALVDHGGADAE